jgi:hypothetical protein
MLYKNKLQQFPRSIVAAIFGFKEEAFFVADWEARRSVKVEL